MKADPDRAIRKVVEHALVKAPISPVLDALGFKNMVMQALDFALANMSEFDKWQAILYVYQELERLVDDVARNYLYQQVTGQGDERVRSIAKLFNRYLGYVK